MVVMKPRFNAPLIIENLGKRRQAVGGAGGIGDDVVVGRVILVVIDSEAHGEIGIGLAGAEMSTFFGSGSDVLGGAFTARRRIRSTQGRRRHSIRPREERAGSRSAVAWILWPSTMM